MEVSKVTNQDGIACAQLLKALKIAKFDSVTGADIEAFMAAKAWISEVATKMAAQLRSSTPPPPPAAPADSQTMKVKAMGPIGTPVGSKPKKRKK